MIIETQRFDKKIIPAIDFARLSESERSRFKSTRIIPARLGSNSFGSIEASLKVPEYAVR
jgi:hypothetical protein